MKNIFKQKINSIINKISDRISSDVRYELSYNYFEKKALISTDYGIEKNSNRKPQIIVSLTTYSKRIYDVYLTIESIFSQTLKADRLVLWLAEDEFSESTLPLILKKMKNRGLEIEFYKDIRSYKKIIPSLKKFPEDIIITIDDDVLYPFDLIEMLYQSHLSNKNNVIFYLGHKILFDEKGRPKPYKEWEFRTKNYTVSLDTLPTGVGGVLYPPKIFDKEVLNEEIFMEIAPYADDIWLKAMTLKNNKCCLKVRDERNYDDHFLGMKTGQDIALHHENLNNGRNDKQFKLVFDKYKLWDKLQG